MPRKYMICVIDKDTKKPEEFRFATVSSEGEIQEAQAKLADFIADDWVEYGDDENSND
jgi:hypothetical protein